MSLTTVEVSVAGVWSTVPALRVEDKNIIIRGTWLKRALIDAEEWLESEVRDPALYVESLRKARLRNFQADLFTFAQKPPDSAPRFRYPMSFDSVAIVAIPSFKAWWEALPQESRKNARRAEKRGVAVDLRLLDDRLVHDIVELNNDSPVRQGKRFVHYGKTPEQVRRDQATFLDRSDFICAYYGAELVGFMKVVYRGDVASILQILPKASHHDKRPANAMLAKAVQQCAARGVPYLTYGQFNYGNKRASSLREFKERNGFRELLLPRYYIPLTINGRLGIKANLHRGFMGVIPPTVIRAGLALRTKWYDMKTLTRRCSSTAEQPNRNR